MYDSWLGSPLGEKSEELMHTKWYDKSAHIKDLIEQKVEPCSENLQQDTVRLREIETQVELIRSGKSQDRSPILSWLFPSQTGWGHPASFFGYL